MLLLTNDDIMKRVINAYNKKRMIDTVYSDEEIITQFEEFYTSKNKSLAALSDKYAKEIMSA